MLDSRWQSLTTHDPDTRSDTGLVVMDDLEVLSFTGSDVRSFLQGYFTCDTSTITSDTLSPAAICNLKGRVTAFGWAATVEETQLTWIVPRSVVPKLQTFLKPYLAFSKTRLDILADDHLLLASKSPDGTGNIADDVQLELITSEAILQQRWQTLGTGQRSDIDSALIGARVPWLSAAVADRFLPQMLNLVTLGAISFDKGCYLGQEVVARAQHRGQVKRQLAALIHTQPIATSPGANLTNSQGRSVGTVIQCVADSTSAMSLCVLQTNAQAPFQDPDTGLTMHR
jgi:folate-binding protein YgfZ